MIKKIKLLTKIFLKDYYQNLDIINKENNKLNKKSIFTWLIIIFAFTLIYFSTKAIDLLQQTGRPILFLKIYFPIIATIMIIQLIGIICKVFFYSKDLEYVIPLPIKAIEIVLAKFNTVVSIMYFTELLFLLIPILMYGILEAHAISFFVFAIIALILFPILFTTIISVIMLFIMKLSKLIKNQDIFQLIVIFVLTFLIVFMEMSYIENIIFRPNSEELSQIQIIEKKVDEINKGFFIIVPMIKMLDNNLFTNKLINLIKIIIINIIPIIIFLILAQKLYLKNIIQNRNDIKRKIKEKNKNKYKCKNKIMQYMKKDIKKIIKNPTYFIQYIFQYLFLVFGICLLLNIFIPVYISEIENKGLAESIKLDNLKLQSILVVIGLIQIVFTFSNLSITAISREGKNAYFMKYIPISLYEQLKIKTLPQIFLNTITIITLLATIYVKTSEVTIGYAIIVFMIAMILNILNSYIMVIIDLKNPNLDWINEESISKNNANKLYQYVITIFICLILSYFASIFENINFAISIILIITILLSILILLKIYIKKNINKLFKKIN